MFKFLATIGATPPNPLTDLETITRWMDDLPMGDSVKVIEALTTQLKEYSAQGKGVTKERLAVLGALDQGAQEMLDVLRSQYLQNPRMSREIESRLWNTVNGYYQEILRAYHTHIMEYIGNVKESKIAVAIPRLTARALWYFGLEAAWNYYRYMQANSKLWKRMHNLYHFAEYEGFATRSLKLYDSEPIETSITQLYLKSLMLDTLNTGSMTPKQLHLVERWMPMLVQDIHLDQEYQQERHAFYVNFEEYRGARRARRITPSEEMRYWDTTGIKDKLDSLRSQISAGVIPAKLGLTEDCRQPACLELLERITYLWSPTPLKQTQRAFERKHSVQAIEVVRGLSDICWNVRADRLRAMQAMQNTAAQTSGGHSYDEMVDMHLYGFVTARTQAKIEQAKTGAATDEKIEDVIVHERWVMENESAGGYGAQIIDQAGDWLRLGKLVGLKPEQKKHWNVGVIRRMLRTQSTQQSIGIEVIAERPVALLLRTKKSEQQQLTVQGIETPDVDLPFPALFLKGVGQQTKTDTLILPSAEFVGGRELWFGARGTTYHIRLKHVLEQGDDWLRAAFEVVSKYASNPAK